MNLLVVDDDSVVRMSMRTLLTAEGHSVATAVDGEDALAKLEGHSFDLIISDVYMPNVDGIRLRNLVRDMPDKKLVPFLFMSGYDDLGTLDMIQKPSMEGFFKKGRPLTELLSWISYLSTPEEKRAGLLPPSSVKAATQQTPGRDPRGRTRISF